MKAHPQTVTMNDIAKMAGMSIATVSRVFSGGSKVSPKTKEKILSLAEKYNFQPNESARTLVAKKSKLIAVVLPDVKNPYFTELLDYIEKLCVKNGYSMIFFNSDGDVEKEKSIIQQIIARQADGLLITMTKTRSNTIPLLKSVPFPVVVMTRNVAGIDSVGIIHAEGGALAADYLLSKNCKSFCYFGLEDDEKFFGFRESLAENNVPKKAITVIGNQDWYFKTVEQGAMILRNYIQNKLKREKTGLFCVNDIYAANAICAAHECGIRIGRDLFIVGFDDTMLCEILYPKLTSVHQPLKEIADYSFSILLRRLENNSVPRNVENIILKPRISIRET